MAEEFYRINRLPPYIFNIVNELKVLARKNGDDIIDFGMGNPDQKTPEHIINKIKPALQKKKIVICDRFTDSTLAYQVHGKNINVNFINNIHKFILNGIKPNITFILKVSSTASRKRLIKRKNKNRYDNFSQSFYSKAQNSFLKIGK